MKYAIIRRIIGLPALCLITAICQGNSAYAQSGHHTGTEVTVTAQPGTSTFTKTGLIGYFYSVTTTGQNTGKYDITNLTTANDWIDSNTPTGAFTATAATLSDTGGGNNYENDGGYGGPDGNATDKTTIETFLAGDASSYTGPDPIMGTTILQIEGYIDVTGLATSGPNANVLTINLGSNDGSYLYIAGLPVITDLNQDNSTSAGQSETNTVLFKNGDGIYTFDLIYWNQEYTGSAPNQGTGNFLALTFSGGNVAFYQVVPEPGSVVGFVIAGLMLASLLLLGRLKSVGLKSA